MQEIIDKIRPSKEERKRFLEVTALFLKLLNPHLKKARAVVGGSGAKDTWLSGNYDVDIFVQFDYSPFAEKSDQLSELLQTYLKKAFPKDKIERLHGSRDYFRLNFKGIEFEVVPSLNVSKPEQAKNITDLSHLHSGWVNAHTKTLKDDVRLAKQFCKTNSIYGAESYIGGFSGYGLEILIAYYKGFNKLLKASLKWKDKEIIDPENHYPKKDVLFHLNSSKQQSPIILIDPTDKNRNAAAALGYKTISKFKRLAKEYLAHPSSKFFQKENLNIEELKKETKRSKTHLVYLEVQPLNRKIDIVGAQLLKAFEFIEQKLIKFKVKKSGWEWNKKNNSFFYFILERNELPSFEIRVGPPLALKEHVTHFKKEHKQVFEEKGKIYAKINVERPKLKDNLTHHLKDKYLKEKVKKITISS
jgi:tRNA nucleotidyltransferase (CCA-adding enzyme)